MSNANYRHVIVNPYDPDQKYAEFCEKVFDPAHKILAMRESKNGFHLHMQGVIKDLDLFNDEITKLKETNINRKRNRNARPVRVLAECADEGMFQYMCKEGPDKAFVVYKNLLTDNDIHELWTQSQAYVAALKENLGDYIKDKVDAGGVPAEPSKLLMLVAMLANDFYKEAGTMPPPNLAALVRQVVIKHFYTPDMRAYLAEKLAARI